MKNFMAQFKTMNPMQKVIFENFIFNVAAKMVQGYGGGSWGSTKVGNLWILKLPVDGPVTLHNTNSCTTITTDNKSASMAFTMLVNNWFWNQYTDKLNDTANQKFSELHYGMRDVAYADGTKFDTKAIYNFTD